MSGDDKPRGPTEPHAFSEAEVRELSGKRTKSVAAITRLKKAVPSGALGKLDTDLPTPPRISRDELPMMRRTTRRSSKALARFAPSELPAEVFEQRKLDRAPVPSKRPPTKKS
jgi:hypothetical protein